MSNTHRYWRIHGLLAQPGHTNDGMGMVGVDWLDAMGASLLPATLSANATDPNWSLALVVNPSLVPPPTFNGWYSGDASHGGAPFNQDWVAFDFGAPVTPVTLKLCSLATFTWTIGSALLIQYSDDGIAWTDRTQLVGLNGADNTLQTFDIDPAPAEPHIAQMVMVVPTSEASEAAGGAVIAQLVMITVSQEYIIPLHKHGWLIRSIQGFPYYIESDGL